MRRFPPYLPFLLIVAATGIVWGSVPWGTFQFDDFHNVVRDPATTEASALAQRLFIGLRPLTRLSYFLDAKLFGLNASGFLAVNLLLHLLTALLVFQLARRRLPVMGAVIAALLFALQPANAEVVAYVSGRSTGLMTPLLLGGLLLHDRGRPIGAIALFTLACLAKEVALVFPALLLLWEITRVEPRPEIKRSLVAATLAAAVLFAWLVSLANYRSLISNSVEVRPALDNLFANGRAIPVMFSLWFRPWALSADHDFNPSDRTIASIAGLIFLATLILLTFLLRRRNPMVALALGWPVIAMIPTNSLISKLDLVTEKPLYLACIGPAIAIGAAASSARFAKFRRIFVGAIAFSLVMLAGASMWRAALWRNPTLLWLDATQKAPGKSRCWNNLGMALLNEQKEADAVVAFEKAVSLDPQNTIALSNLNIARILCGEECYR